MEHKIRKCSLKKHQEIQAITFCQVCKLYMCNKCESYHKELFEESHHEYKLNKESKEIFTGFCNEISHTNKLEYFCKDHNQLCCAECIIKIKSKGKGKHKDCQIFNIEDIKEEKRSKLEENSNILEKLSISLEESINKLKLIFEKINENKEELKSKIQKIFTKIRNSVNDREDELLLEVDKKFQTVFFKEDIIKDNENLPKKIKQSLEACKLNNDWNDENKLSMLIISIENNIKKINNIKESINNCNSNTNKKIEFFPKEELGINNILENIKFFGKINYGGNYYKFKKCPENISEERKYSVLGEEENILIKTGSVFNWMGTICEKQLEYDKENRWKIKFLKTQKKDIMIGVAPSDFDINKSIYDKCGWYLYCYNCRLRSGPPHNYNRESNLNKIKDEVILVMDMKKRTLKFIIDNKDKGVSYTNIPIDKPLFPAVFMFDKDDTIEIEEC